MKVSVRQVFGIDSDMEVPAYSGPDRMCRMSDLLRFDAPRRSPMPRRFCPQPPRDHLGLSRYRQSTHVEQVAARLNCPCVRVNLDSHISRIDLIAGGS